MRMLIITSGLWHNKPWWWQYIQEKNIGLHIEYARIVINNKKPSGIMSLDAVSLIRKTLTIIGKAGSKYDYIATFECSWETFIIAFFQTIMFCKTPKHVLLHFIMREKENNLRSKLKYLFMRFCFSSAHMVVCSSRAEGKYYMDVFRWNSDKVRFIPIYADPSLLRLERRDEQDYIIAAGRTFRDYATLFSAVRGLDIPLIVVVSKINLKNLYKEEVPKNVKILCDIPRDELNRLIIQGRLVVVPLENRKISVGQSVLQLAMALGKATIVSKINGTEDYVKHKITGYFVQPHDVFQMREAIQLLYSNNHMRNEIGRAAKQIVETQHSPLHFFQKLAEILES